MKGLKLKAKNKLTLKRVEVICVLIFALNFLTPLQQILGSNRYPTGIEISSLLVTATLQVVTLLLALVQKDETPTAKKA